MKESRHKTLLVTGAAGFLGSNLCRRLLSSGQRVIGVDNFSTGRMRNLSDLAGHRRFRLIRQDITQPLRVTVDEIYNLACPASPVHYQADPVQTLTTCLHGSLHLLELARRCQARILQASTSEVYGDPEQHPQQESYRGAVNCIGPRACYDEGKRSAETLFFDYQRRYGVTIKVARIFNTYGPSMQPDDGRVVSNFIIQALQNQPITLYGDGSQTRSFCYVDDLLDGFLRLMATPAEFTGPVNLGNPDERTVKELAELIIDLTGSRSRIVYRPLPIDDPVRRCPDIALAKSTLGWEPRVPLAQGLGKTIAHFEQVLRETGSRPVKPLELSLQDLPRHA